MKSPNGFSFTEKLSVLAILSILTAAGANQFVDLITASNATACHLNVKSIERAEQYYHLAYQQHTTAYNNLTQITALCQLVNYGFLNNNLFDKADCSYFWRLNPAGKRFVYCMNCSDIEAPENQLESLIIIHKSQGINNLELSTQLLAEYRFIETYLNKYPAAGIFLSRLLGKLRAKYSLRPY